MSGKPGGYVGEDFGELSRVAVLQGCWLVRGGRVSGAIARMGPMGLMGLMSRIGPIRTLPALGRLIERVGRTRG